MEDIIENRDESFLRWRVNIEADDSSLLEDEECGSEQLLKTVVRTSYLYHLRQSLRKNLEISKQNYDIQENIINKVIKGCSALLEEKALRSCMIAQLYQRVMAQTIKEVKKATSEHRLYNPLKQFAEKQNNILMSFADKEVQTDLSNAVLSSQIADIYNQTQQLIHKINAVPIISQDFNKQNTDLSSSPDHNNVYLGNSNINNDLKTVNRTQTIKTKSDIISNDNEVNEININDSEGVNGIRKCISNKRKKNDTSEIIKHEGLPKNIDEMPNGCAPEIAANKNDPFEVKLRSCNFAECIALWYNLEYEMEELPYIKKRKIEEKFVQLFGKDHKIDYYFLTDEQKLIACRKRIAKFVVVELTDYYNKKRIVSKQLFKMLAKHITSILLNRSLYPDVTEIKKTIEEFFMDGRVIKAEADIV